MASGDTGERDDQRDAGDMGDARGGGVPSGGIPSGGVPSGGGGEGDPALGRLLAGRYRTVERLGRGGMGVVYRAVDERLGRQVAVKELRSYSDASAHELAALGERMRREARTAALVRHPGVIAVHDVAEERGRPVIVMELVDGPSLAGVLVRQGVLEPREAAAVGLAVADALAAAHRAGVLHRDVKPGNVLLGRDGRVVLTDFGIAGPMEDGRSGEGAAGADFGGAGSGSSGSGSSGSGTGSDLGPDELAAVVSAVTEPSPQAVPMDSLTRSGDLVGTLEYLAPERVRGASPGPASDLWSLAATLYTMVEGVPPFRRGTTWATLNAIVVDGLREPVRSGPLAPVLRAMLAKDPEDRPDAGQARRLLGAVATSGVEAEVEASAGDGADVRHSAVAAGRTREESLVEPAAEPVTGPATEPVTGPTLKPAAKRVRPVAAPAPALPPDVPALPHASVTPYRSRRRMALVLAAAVATVTLLAGDGLYGGVVAPGRVTERHVAGGERPPPDAHWDRGDDEDPAEESAPERGGRQDDPPGTDTGDPGGETADGAAGPDRTEGPERRTADQVNYPSPAGDKGRGPTAETGTSAPDSEGGGHSGSSGTGTVRPGESEEDPAPPERSAPEPGPSGEPPTRAPEPAPPAASAPAPEPDPDCVALGGGRFGCVVRADAPIRSLLGTVVGVLHAGTHHFTCQTDDAARVPRLLPALVGLDDLTGGEDGDLSGVPHC